MHNPMTVAHEIRLPWGGWRDNSGHIYRPTFITIWHVDPETDGSDDSCGWFMRSRHGDKKVLENIRKAFTFEWNHGVPYGWFNEYGDPQYSTIAIGLGMFRIATNCVFGHWSRKANNFMRDHLHEIIHFAENNCDSMHASITNAYRKKTPKKDDDISSAKQSIHRDDYSDWDSDLEEDVAADKQLSRLEEDRIAEMSSCVYSWILRANRPWWKHPKWHVWHWRIQIHPLQSLRRYLLTRCAKCGKPFRNGEMVIALGWDAPKPRWFECFRGEREVSCHDCYAAESPSANIDKPISPNTTTSNN